MGAWNPQLIVGPRLGPICLADRVTDSSSHLLASLELGRCMKRHVTVSFELLDSTQTSLCSRDRGLQPTSICCFVSDLPSRGRELKCGSIPPGKLQQCDASGMLFCSYAGTTTFGRATDQMSSRDGISSAITDRFLTELPPELAGDIHDRGIILAGGGTQFVAWMIFCATGPNFRFELLKNPDALSPEVLSKGSTKHSCRSSFFLKNSNPK